MMTPTRIVRLIGIAGLVGWMGMVGWVAKTTQAQNDGQNPPGSPPAAMKSDDRTQAAQEPPKAPSTGVLAPLPVAPEPDLTSNPPPPLPAMVGEQVAAKAEPPATSLPLAIHAAGQPAATGAESTGLRTLPESQLESSSDDPEQTAQSFVERSQKEAEEHLRFLTAEAQKLRVRLAKLESGIKKWQGLVNALKSSEGVSITTTATAPGAEDAGDLEPVKPSQAGGVRTDKRVKWATATSPATGAGAQPGETVSPPQQLPAGQPLQVVVPGPAPR